MLGMRAFAAVCFLFVNILTVAATTIQVDVAPHTGGASVSINQVKWMSAGVMSVAGVDSSKMSNSGCTTASGASVLGNYNSTTCAFSVPIASSSVRFQTTVRTYGQEFVTLEQHFLDGVQGIGPNDMDKLSTTYPSFNVANTNLGYLTWANNMACSGGYLQCTYTSPLTAAGLITYPKGNAGGDPVVIFDNSPEQNTLVFSSSSQFMARSIVANASAVSLSAGAIGSMTSIPAGYRIESILVAGTGVNAAMRKWGALLLKKFNKQRVVQGQDRSIDYLSYYTDNGAFYYYNTEKNQTYQQTMKDVIAHAKSVDIPYQSLQIDSWWYFKDPKDNGVVNWSPMPDVFPGGLAGLTADIGMGLIAHNRFWSKNNIYAKQGYDFISDPGSKYAMPNSTKFWTDLLYNASVSGIHTYEQDWLHNEWLNVDVALSSPTMARDWLLQMGEGASANGVTIQYCMAYPRHLLQSVEIPAVTQARASDDYSPVPSNARSNQWSIGVSALLSSSLGLRPFKDDFWSSTKSQPGNPYQSTGEVAPVLQSFVSVLSTGPVGPSDMIGAENRTTILRTCNAAGLLLKPDVPALAIDSTFSKRAFGNSGPDGEVWSSRVTLRGVGTFGILLGATLHAPYSVVPSDLNQPGLGVHPVSGSMVSLMAFPDIGLDAPIIPSFDQDHPISLPVVDKTNPQLYHIAPVLESGWAVMGERDKVVPVSNQRIAALDSSSDGIVIRLVGAPKEVLSISLWDSKTKSVVVVTCHLSSTVGEATLSTFPSPACV